MKLLEKIQTDERAVSPVLGVALLIAMTVILAGVVGYVALGVDAGSADAPQASLTFQQDDAGNVDVVHDGGAKIQEENVNVSVEGDGSGTGITSDLTTGDSTQVAENTSADDVVRIVWNDPDSNKEVLLAEYTVE